MNLCKSGSYYRRATLLLSTVTPRSVLHRRLSTQVDIEQIQKNALESFGFSADSVCAGVFDGEEWGAKGPVHECINPSNGQVLARVQHGDVDDYHRCAKNAIRAQQEWQLTPAPTRGEIVRQIGNALRERKAELGALLSLEMGKILAEGLGEVQEFIDVCDFAMGLSRQLPGQVVPSERAQHALVEAWHPLGTVGIITAFNFPNAVFGWNSAISLICGNTQVVKGAESASLVTIATQKIIADVLRNNGMDGAIATLCQASGQHVGEALIRDEKIDLVSFTGSTAVGKHVNQVVASRFGKAILELGGNNAILVMPSADMDMALRSIVFAAAGTCGQRCTSLRRLLLHDSVYDSFVPRLVEAYQSLPCGHPLDPRTLVGPLHGPESVELFLKTIEEAQAQGGKLLTGGTRVFESQLGTGIKGGNFVNPAIIEISSKAAIVQEERFVPVLYVCKVDSFEEAVSINNSVKQGLSSALFSRDMRETLAWTMGPRGSDTGIVNVNTSCSGAEIGLAFGGNKNTGGGRETGSDAWKQYMRRTSICINFGDELPLAQGVTF